MDQSAFATTHASTARAAIHDLPPEIILSVFLHCIANDPALRDNKVTPTVVAASQVCRRWRSITLSHGQCWSNVNICARHWAKLFVERSGSLALSITATEHLTSDQLKVFEPHFPRVRELVLGTSSGGGKRSSTEPMSSLLSLTSMPLLDSLHFDDQPRYEHHATAPSLLRRVILRDGCYISPLFPILNSALVHLELSRCHSVEAIGSDTVHSILHGTPHLQSLVLDYAQKSYSAPVSAPRVEPATLPRLRRLHVCDTLSNLVRRLQLLQIPHEAQITVASQDPVSIATLSAVTSLANFLNGHTSAASHTLFIEAPTSGTRTGRIALSYQAFPGGRELSRVELATGAGHAPVPCILHKLLGTGLTHVHNLRVSHGHFFALCAWTDLHRQAPAVKRITITGQASIANSLLQALEDGAFSELEELTVVEATLGGRGGVDMSAWADVRTARPTVGAHTERCTIRTGSSSLS